MPLVLWLGPDGASTAPLGSILKNRGRPYLPSILLFESNSLGWKSWDESFSDGAAGKWPELSPVRARFSGLAESDWHVMRKMKMVAAKQGRVLSFAIGDRNWSFFDGCRERNWGFGKMGCGFCDGIWGSLYMGLVVVCEGGAKKLQLFETVNALLMTRWVFFLCFSTTVLCMTQSWLYSISTG